MHAIYSRGTRTRRSRLLIQMLLDESQQSKTDAPVPRQDARTSKPASIGNDANLRHEVHGFRIVGLADEN